LTASPPLSAGLDFAEVAVEDVSRHFGRRRALSHVTFTATSGAIVGLLGPNGAGKSTMMSLLATLLHPSSGRIRYGAHDSTDRGVELRASIGVLGHDLFLYPELTARENLEFFAGLHAVPDPSASARTALDKAGLSDRADDPVSSFSRGMRQRVALERALIHRPRLVLLDEPFTGLDDASAAGLVDRLRELRGAGGIVVLATHDLEIAEGIIDKAVFLRDGRMVAEEKTQSDLRARYRSVMGQSRVTAAHSTTGPVDAVRRSGD
jgi:heme ABC exporter ATP-binding subunit CcmA